MLPDFKTLTPVGQLDALTLDMEPRNFEDGFPGRPDLIKWFGIVFKAELAVPADGQYVFRTKSDDGSKVYVDGVLIVDNDGDHGPQERSSPPTDLKAGKRVLQVDWFQGRPTQMALQVFWKKPGDSDFEIVPATVLKHGKDCKLKDLGEFN